MVNKHRADTVSGMTRTSALLLAALGTLLLTSCSKETFTTIAEDAVDFAGETALLVAAEAIASQLDGTVDPDGRIPVAEVQKTLAAYDTLAEVSFPDANGDGFVDGNRIQISLQGASACVHFGTDGTNVAKGECPRS